MVEIKKIGITGGRGFIGNSVKDHFLKKNLELIDFDCNLSEFEKSLEFFQNKGFPDLIIHFAGRFSQDRNIAVRDNLISTLNLLKLISKSPTNNIIFASTGAIYGNSGSNPIDEGHTQIPNTEYGLIKYWCEQAILFHERQSDLKSTILRFPSVYGLGNNKGIIFEWQQSIKKNNEIFINGDGSQRRSFINSEDIAEGIENIIKKNVNGIYNFSHPDNFSLIDLASLFVNQFNCNLRFKNKDNNNLQSMVLESSKLYRALKWNPSRDISSYIKSISI